MKTLNGVLSIEQIQFLEMVRDVTNDKLITWYKNAKLDFGIVGGGKCNFILNPEDDEIVECVIVYIEDGVKFHSSFSVYVQNVVENDIKWLYNIWCEGTFNTVELKGEY